jgi:hypothetical protein
VYNGQKNPAPQKGRYTLTITGTNGTSLLPGGNGYATVTVNAAGRTSFAGSLADGTHASQSSIVSGTAQWPLYCLLYGGKGSLLGWVTFTNSQELGGDLFWSKPARPRGLYPAGFSWLTSLYGARYLPPGRGSNIFGSTSSSLTLTLQGGELTETNTSAFTLNDRNQVSSTNPGLKLTFVPGTGLFRGHIPNPDVPAKKLSFNGAVLQNQTNGFGYFLGTNQSGSVLITPP